MRRLPGVNRSRAYHDLFCVTFGPGRMRCAESTTRPLPGKNRVGPAKPCFTLLHPAAEVFQAAFVYSAIFGRENGTEPIPAGIVAGLAKIPLRLTCWRQPLPPFHFMHRSAKKDPAYRIRRMKRGRVGAFAQRKFGLSVSFATGHITAPSGNVTLCH